ncbi:phosphoribosyltransferase [Haloparvum sp. PAK95]|uniref:phosphoribosyltransferase n=1 Tax=Haloparvum sp. PAK95 TaxID=3418962 RepID=UPI003D2ECE80
MFQDRTDAGQQLADVLRERDLDADLVLGIPRGALPVARPVADALDVPLDIVVAKKMSAPENPEFAIGAAASDGSVYLDDETIERLGVDSEYIERERERAAETAREKVETYRQGDPPDVAGKTIVVVDDGVATGATMTACLRQLRAQDARRLVVGVPVGSPRSLAALEAEADEVVALDEPEGFRAVGQFYREFGQVSDEEAIAYLRGEE